MRTNSMFHRPMRLLGACSLLLAGLWAGQAVAQASIVNSKHDLSSTSTATIKQSSTSEICVFCHTPHGGDQAKGPLWNRGATVTAYTVYASDTLETAALTTPASVSAACMSCHDGTVALDNLINAPGSGGYTPGGTSQIYTWAGGVNMIPAGITNLSDLTNDHPIGVPYCGGFAASACKDADFKTAALYKNNSVAALATGVAGDKWWIDSGSSAGARDKGDLVLYQRDFGGPLFPSVECASCHNPHGSGAGLATFLRISNAASALCTTCHNK